MKHLSSLTTLLVSTTAVASYNLGSADEGQLLLVDLQELPIPELDQVSQPLSLELYQTEPEGIILDVETSPPGAHDEEPDLGAQEGTPAKKPAKYPFNNPVKNGIGLALMCVLLILSTAGGLSGAGSNIPIMLILFDLEFKECVPISAFLAVMSTLFRFILNFKQVHPKNPERNTVNYEIVTLVMPGVFMGSTIGIMFGKFLGEERQAILFGVTVAWSIYTTSKKTYELYQKEKQADQQKEGLSTPLKEGGEESLDYTQYDEATPELQKIMIEEKYHFTFAKFKFTALCFANLCACQVLKGKTSTLTAEQKNYVLAAFIVINLLLSVWSVKNLNQIHNIKERDGYKFASGDTRFENTGQIVKLTFFCFIAAILCGSTGIAGGMVLGPLFLQYGMIPQVMSATNQYITMVASLSVAAQFAYLGELNMQYAGVFGVVTLVCAYIGITSVNKYVQRTGKQSLISLFLTLVLIIALLSLPINFILKQNRKKTQQGLKLAMTD